MLYDLGIIGAGTAGLRAAEAASSCGFSTLLIEQDPYRSYAFDNILTDLPLPADSVTPGLWPKPDFAFLKDRHQKKSLAYASHTEDRLNRLGVAQVRGFASLRSARRRFPVIGTPDNFFECRRLLVAAGSIPKLHLPAAPPGMLLSHEPSLFSGRDRLPETLLIIGAGLRALQAAARFAWLGVSVTVLRRRSPVAPELETETAALLKRRLEDYGVRFLRHVRIRTLHPGMAILETEAGERDVSCELVMPCTPCRPASRGMRLAQAGVYLSGGAIVTDLTGRTNLPDVYAAGDITGRGFTARTAARAAEVCISNMMGSAETVPYHRMPHVFEGLAEAASLGQRAARAPNQTWRASEIKLTLEDGGMCKLFGYADSLVGAHMFGAGAVLCAHELSLLLEEGLTIGQLRKRFAPSSPMGDALREALIRLAAAE